MEKVLYEVLLKKRKKFPAGFRLTGLDITKVERKKEKLNNNKLKTKWTTIQTVKTTAIRLRAVRETGASQHHGDQLNAALKSLNTMVL